LNIKNRDYWEELEKALLSTAGFTDWAIHQLKEPGKWADLRLASCCRLLYQGNEQLERVHRENIWAALPPLRTHPKALVRSHALGLNLIFLKSKDTSPIFLRALDDKNPRVEGDGFSVTFRAFIGITSIDRPTLEATERIVAFLELDNDFSQFVAGQLPRHV